MSKACDELSHAADTAATTPAFAGSSFAHAREPAPHSQNETAAQGQAAAFLAFLQPAPASLFIKRASPPGGSLILCASDNLEAQTGISAAERVGRMTVDTNAWEAAGRGGCTVRLSARRVEALPAGATPPTAQSRGAWTCLAVSDDGPGMDDATRARRLEPFFTTKHSGRRLGLAVVQRIIRAHGGALLADSAPGRGATFEVYLPEMTETEHRTSAGSVPAPEQAERRTTMTALAIVAVPSGGRFGPVVEELRSAAPPRGGGPLAEGFPPRR